MAKAALPHSPIVQKFLTPHQPSGSKTLIQIGRIKQANSVRILSPEGQEIKLHSRPDPVKTSSNTSKTGVSKTIETLALAFHWSKLIDQGRVGSIDEIASREKINPTKARKILRLALLSPSIINFLVKHPEVSVDTLKRRAIPVDWLEQEDFLFEISDTTSSN